MDEGVLLSKIELQTDAESVRNYFAERAMVAMIDPLATAGNHRVFLLAINREQFAKFVTGANIQLIV
jgi:hypothetical protein